MKTWKHWTIVALLAIFAIIACVNDPLGGRELSSPSVSSSEPEPVSNDGTDTSSNPLGNKVFSVASKSVQEALNEAVTEQESVSLAKFISATYDPDLKYIILTYKVGTIKGMFLQYLSTAVVAMPGREFSYSQTVGYSETEKVENIHTTIVNFNGTVCFAGAGAFAGADVFAGLASLSGLGPQAKADAYAVAGAVTGRLNFDFQSVTKYTYTRTYQQFFVVQNTIKQDMSIYPAGKSYVVAAFADVGIYQILKYDPQTKTATAIPGESLWFNVESLPIWDMYEYSSDEELSIQQRLRTFEMVNVEVKEDDLFLGLEKSQTITFNVGNPRVPDNWYRTDWKPITLIFPLLRNFGYKTVSFEWKTYWAENEGRLDCTAHVILDCADINLYRENGWNYYDKIINPGAGWKWATWNFSSPIGTVTDRPYIRCAYGYDKREEGFWWWEGKAYYDLSGTVTVTVTAQK